MNRLSLVAASLLLAAFVSPAQAQEKNFLDQPYIEVNGYAKMEVEPDEIYLQITINEKDNKGKVSVEEQERAMYKALKAAGIDVEKSLVVDDMSSDLQSYFLRKDAILTTKSYELKVNSAKQLTAAFQALQSAGISDVNLTRTDVSNMAELRQQVRAKAAKQAQQNASTLAEALGTKIGPALYVQDYGDNNARSFRPIMLAKSAMANDEAEAGMPDLSFQKITIEQSVLVRFWMR